MDKLELIKENVQPLKNGRKIDSLRAALNMDSTETKKRDETKLEFENKLTNTTDFEEKLDVYFNFINWIEQNYPQGGKDLKDILEKCIQSYFEQKKFSNNEKLLSIFLKYTNILEKPLELFNFFYKAGFFKKLAQFYISWSYCYETQNNFDRALKVIEAGINKEAQPINELKTTQNNLQVRTMRHVISNPEDNEKGGQRKALNSLKAKVDRHGKAEAPVKRNGNAVTSSSKGLTNLAETSINQTKAEQLNILCDENEEPFASTVHPRITVTSVGQPLPINNQENERDPGKWNENKLNCKGLRKREPMANFEILEDPVENAPEPPKVSETPKPPSRNEKPMADFPVAKFEDEAQMKKYIWYGQLTNIYQNNVEYSFEELMYQKWVEMQERRRLDTIQEHSGSVSKSMQDSSDNETMPGATTMIREFYNGTLATSVYIDHSQSQVDMQSMIKKEIKQEPIQKFEIFSETTDKFNCTATQSTSPNVGPSINEEEFQTKPIEFTISEFRSCSSSTPSVNKTFKRPANQTMKMLNHPNFVTGITSKLSPIIETSRENNKSTSSSSGMSSTGGHTTRKLFNFPDIINPFENNLRTHLLQKLSDPVDFRNGYSAVQGLLPSLQIAHTFSLGSKTYVPAVELSSSFLCKVFMVFTEEKEPHELYPVLTVKQYTNLNYWDFYIRDELNRRLIQNARCNISLSLMPMRETVFYSNGYLSIHDSVPYATLKQAIERFHQKGTPFPDTLMQYFILELILIITNLHECHIIHADICPENIFFFDSLKNFDSEPHGSNTKTLRFADFSKAIDMQLLPEGTVFSDNCTDKEYLYILKSKSWTYSIDWLQLLNCIHQMCYGTDMMAICENSQWKLREAFKQPARQYLNGLFDQLLNLEANQKPHLDAFIQEIVRNLTDEVNKWDLAEEYFEFLDTNRLKLV